MSSESSADLKVANSVVDGCTPPLKERMCAMQLKTLRSKCCMPQAVPCCRWGETATALTG